MVAGTATAWLAGAPRGEPRARAGGEGGLVMRRRERASCAMALPMSLAPHGARRRGAPALRSCSRPTSARIRTRASSGGMRPGALEAESLRNVRLPAHVLSLAHRRAARPPEPLRRQATGVRTCRADRSRAAGGCATTSASRAPASDIAAGARGRHARRRCATGASRAKAHLSAAAITLDCAATSAGFRARARTRGDAAGAAARRRRLLAQRARAGAGEPLLQPAAARGAGPPRRSTAPRTPVRGTAWLDHEWSDALLAARRGRLGLDRHEPRRRLRADRVSPAAPRRQRAVGRRQLSHARSGGAQLRRRRGAIHAGPHVAQRGVAGDLSGRVDVDVPAGRFQRARAARRAGARQPREHRHRSTGKA